MNITIAKQKILHTFIVNLYCNNIDKIKWATLKGYNDCYISNRIYNKGGHPYLIIRQCDKVTALIEITDKIILLIGEHDKLMKKFIFEFYYNLFRDFKLEKPY